MPFANVGGDWTPFSSTCRLPILAVLLSLAGALPALRVDHLVGDLGLRLLIDAVLVELAHQLLALLVQQSLQIAVLHPLT